MTEHDQIRLENIANTDYEIFALLKQRYSPRIFREEPVRRSHLKQLFEAVRWAASSANEQPWRLIYSMRGSTGFENIVSCLTPDNKKWAARAPVLLVSIYKDAMSYGTFNLHALHDLGLGMGNLTVQAQYMGIGVHSMAGFNVEQTQKLLKVPKGYHPAYTIALGYYGGELNTLPKDLQQRETEERERMPQEDFAFENSWRD